jgi:NADPH-dependent ferric siderophore reductase
MNIPQITPTEQSGFCDVATGECIVIDTDFDSHAAAAHSPATEDRQPPRIYELRTYHAHPGKLDALVDRFRHTTTGLLEKHGMEVAGFWTADGGDGDTLVYLLSFPDRASAKASWKEFFADPGWDRILESEQKDPWVAKIDSTYLLPADFSALR